MTEDAAGLVDGHRIELADGGVRAVLEREGASLRRLEVDGFDLLAPIDSPAAAERFYAGAVCAPWPNRIRESRYEWRGHEQRLTPTPGQDGHALHGLVARVPWEVVEAGGARAVLRTDVAAAPGWPFAAEFEIEYTLVGRGLAARLRAVNAGDVALPYGCCPHPYLVAPTPVGSGLGRIDGWHLELPVASVLAGTEKIGSGPPGPLADDLAEVLSGREPLGGTELDHCFGDVRPGPDGRARVRLRGGAGGGADGAATELAWGGWAPWLQVFTSDEPTNPAHRAGVAVEPMSCPPDAYNSGIGVVELAPGAAHEAEWEITLVD